jgi:murein DD-endopeptidase MepM/ murein hydrolase activator NlpD
MRALSLLLALPLMVSGQSFNSFPERNTITQDSGFTYCLPYEKGKSYLLIQGNGGWLSHKGETALDFKMKKGTHVHAMRAGVVIEIKEDSRKGGLSRRYFADGNYILVRHEDNSFGWYFHLSYNGVRVHPGEFIHAGQFIGLSGNSGYSAFPHLHVEVVIPYAGSYRQLPMKFRVQGTSRYLKPGRFYKN